MNIVNSSFKYNVKINKFSSSYLSKRGKTINFRKFSFIIKLGKTNEGYALSKIVTLKYCQYKVKYKKNFISIQPANLWGRG